MRTLPSTWTVLAFFLLTFASIFSPGCTCEGPHQQENRSILACQAKQKATTTPPLQSQKIVPGAIPVSFNVAESGTATSRRSTRHIRLA